MGLDMYLYKDGEEIAYWRKANAIHKWFGDHVAGGKLKNCEEYKVTRKDLIELRDTCLSVWMNSHLEQMEKDGQTRVVIEDPSVAKKLLPTAAGYFYGDLEYDEQYLDSIKFTANKLDEILSGTDFEKEEITYFAWW